MCQDISDHVKKKKKNKKEEENVSQAGERALSYTGQPRAPNIGSKMPDHERFECVKSFLSSFLLLFFLLFSSEVPFLLHVLWF